MSFFLGKPLKYGNFTGMFYFIYSVPEKLSLR